VGVEIEEAGLVEVEMTRVVVCGFPSGEEWMIRFSNVFGLFRELDVL